MAAMPVLKPLHDEAGLVRLIVSHLPGGLRQRAWPASRSCVEPGRAPSIDDAAELVHDGARGRLPRAGQVRRADRVQRAAAGRLDRRRRLVETDEEQKLRNESRKILGIPDLLVCGTCVRVPVFTGHSLSINAEFAPAAVGRAGHRAARRRAGRRAGRRADPAGGRGQRPDATSAASARTRASPDGRGLALFVSNDNLRKGAALNTVQIAEVLLRG